MKKIKGKNPTPARAKKASGQATLYKELLARAEFWRTNASDPHGIATAVYVSLIEVAGCLSVRAASTNGHKRRKKHG